MRRKDREVTDESLIHDIISRCDCIRIGFNDNGEVYIVPLNFGYERIDGKYILYMHGAKEGRKVKLMSTSPRVGFEMDTNYRVNVGATSCEYSARFQSIIGNGTISLVEDRCEKIHGLGILMNNVAMDKNAYKDMNEDKNMKKDWEFAPEMVDAVAVYKLEIKELSCKEHK